MSTGKKLSLPRKETTDADTKQRRLGPSGSRALKRKERGTPAIETAPPPDAGLRDDAKPAKTAGRPPARSGSRQPGDDRERPSRRSAADAPRKTADGNTARPARAPRPEGNFAKRSGSTFANRDTGAASRPRPTSGRIADTADRPRPRPAVRPPVDPAAPLRLSKRMAELGLCSRREADEYIERGLVRVDGVVVSELGSRVLPTQTIELERAAQAMQAQRVTILLHKPIGYVSGQAEDGYEPAVVLVKPENQWEADPSPRRLYGSLRNLAPAGRLDIDSTGLLVLTQDGRIAKRLIGDDSEVEKEYLVRVEGQLSADGMRLLNHGLELDGVKLRPAKVSWQNEDQLRFVLREGRKRQIRRMCELVGLRVTGLKRIRIGSVVLGALPPGQWRYLGEHEKF